LFGTKTSTVGVPHLAQDEAGHSADGLTRVDESLDAWLAVHPQLGYLFFRAPGVWRKRTPDYNSGASILMSS